MKRLFAWILALMLAVSCIAPLQADAADYGALQAQFTERINQYRSSHGVAALETDAVLTEAAQTRASELAQRFDHTRPNGSKYYSLHEKIEAECYYNEYNQELAGSAVRAADWFYHSRAHREILMDSRVKSIGVGIYQKGSTTYYDVLLSTSPADGSLGQSAGGQSDGGQTGFQDVKSTDYFAPAVQWAVSRGITSGMTETTFAPNAPCTRAQIVTFLWRAAGSPSPSLFARNRFTDVQSRDYYYSAALWAQERGIVTGVTSSSFAPNKTCTRAEAVTFLWRYRGSPSAGASGTFRDVLSGAWYAQAVAWATAAGVTSGVSSGRFAPNDTCMRGQIITFLYRAVN